MSPDKDTGIENTKDDIKYTDPPTETVEYKQSPSLMKKVVAEEINELMLKAKTIKEKINTAKTSTKKKYFKKKLVKNNQQALQMIIALNRFRGGS